MTKKKKKKSEAPHDPFNEGVKDGAVDFEKRIRSAFSAGGPLAGATEHFMHRDGQLSFALDVARAIENHGTEVIEAGTGTGKTFAYLTPAILAGCKVIVSTAGKPLQDQLFGKDLPAVCKALGVNASTALLKGRSNYICLYRMETAQSEARLPSPAAVRDFQKIAFFAKTDETGDRARCHGVPDDSPAWPYVTSTAENCLGSDCPRIKDCFVYKARAKAKASDIVTISIFRRWLCLPTPNQPGPETTRGCCRRLISRFLMKRTSFLTLPRPFSERNFRPISSKTPSRKCGPGF